jgi:hypothetical protein
MAKVSHQRLFYWKNPAPARQYPITTPLPASRAAITKNTTIILIYKIFFKFPLSAPYL